MKFLSICDPTRYDKAPLDVPAFYQHLAADARVDFYHIPAPWVQRADLTYLPVVPAAGQLSYSEFLALGQAPAVEMDLSEFDGVFCRTLKPFDDGYLNRLSTWEEKTRFVNSPTGKKEQMRADFLLHVAKDFMSDAVATTNCKEAFAFFEKHRTIVAKRSNSCGGRGVFKIWYGPSGYQIDNVMTGTGSFANFSDVMRFLRGNSIEPIQFCRFLPRTDQGDKRVVVVDGEIYGAYVRRSKSGHWVNNVSADGECVLTDVTAEEREAIAHTVGYYRDLGLHTLGYDFLMDNDGTWRISEINAGNIGGFARLELLTGEPVMDRLTDWLLAFTQRSTVQQSVYPALLAA